MYGTQTNGSRQSRGHEIIMKKLNRTIDDNHEKADLEQEVNKIPHLTKFQWVILICCLKRYEYFFSANICEWNGPPVYIPLDDEDKP